MSDEVKRVEELLAMGGAFYSLNGVPWCDTAVDSWRYDSVQGGYVRVPDEERPKPAIADEEDC